MQNFHQAWKVHHFPREPVPARKEETHIGDQTEAICGQHTLGTDQQPFVDTDQKPSTSSKDTHKKGRMTAIIGMTAMIGITLITTLKTVNMITTCILMSVNPQDSFSNKLD